MEEVACRGRDDPVGEHRTGAHLQVRRPHDPDRGERRGSYDLERDRLAAVDAYLHGVPELLVQRAQRRGAEHDLVGRLQPVTAQQRRGDGGPGRGAHDRHVHPVEREGGVVDTGPGFDQRIRVEQLGRRLAGDVAEAAAPVNVVVPVPAVQGRVRYERVEARPESHRGDHHRHRQDGTQNGRPDRHCAASHSRLQREAHAGDRRRGEAGPGGRRRDPRGGEPARPVSGPVGQRAERCQHGHAAEDQHQGQYADPDHRPVRAERHAEEWPHRPDWPERREAHGHDAGEQRSEQQGTE